MTASAHPRGMVHFVGGGPGAPALLTLRGAEVIADADVVIWGQNLLMEEAVTRHAREDAELVPWPPATMKDLHAVYDRAASDGLRVARLYAGDPTIFARVREEIADVTERGLPYEIVPGVSAVGAAAAALAWDLTGPRDDHRPLSLVHEAGTIGDAQGHAMAVFCAGLDPDELQRRLLEGGYAPDTPCAVARRVSFPDEHVAVCRLADLAERLGEHEAGRHTIVLVVPGAVSAP